MLEKGQIVCGRYQIVEHLSRGGMADVWKAIDLEAKPRKEFVAFKIMLGTVRAASERFQREAEIHRELSSPNIVPFRDSGHFEFKGSRYPYCVFAYIADGRTLEHVINSADPERDPETGKIKGTLIERKRMVSLMLQIATGVRDAHKSSPPIVHRDLKPSNILVLPVSIGLEHVFVADFGIARLLETALEDGASKLTVGACLGTPDYMSPQQAQPPTADPEVDKLRFDPRNDTWSLGVTFYEMITGEHPFVSRSSGGTESQMLARLIAGNLTLIPISEYCIGVDQRLADLVTLCLDLDLEKRPRIDEILKALNVVLLAENQIPSMSPLSMSGSVMDVEIPRPPKAPSDAQIEIGSAETVSIYPDERTPSSQTTSDPPQGYDQLLDQSAGTQRYDEIDKRARTWGAVLALAVMATLGVTVWVLLGTVPSEFNNYTPQLTSVSRPPASHANSDQQRGSVVTLDEVVIPVPCEISPAISAVAPNTGTPNEAKADADVTTSGRKPKHSSKRGYGAAPPVTVLHPEVRDPSFH